ncbi:MAG: hypothetical protein IJH07_08650 [Ruminococcus sp.]|nr:hypothetical protein [Ruminococcus sp.]
MDENKLIDSKMTKIRIFSFIANALIIIPLGAAAFLLYCILSQKDELYALLQSISNNRAISGLLLFVFYFGSLFLSVAIYVLAKKTIYRCIAPDIDFVQNNTILPQLRRVFTIESFEPDNYISDSRFTCNHPNPGIDGSYLIKGNYLGKEFSCSNLHYWITSGRFSTHDLLNGICVVRFSKQPFNGNVIFLLEQELKKFYSISYVDLYHKDGVIIVINAKLIFEKFELSTVQSDIDRLKKLLDTIDNLLN